MKKVFKLLMVAVALTAGFTSCSKDSSSDTDTTGGIIPNTGETYAKITLTQSAPDFFRGPSATEHLPTVDERKINTATLFIFNAIGTLEAKVSMTVNAGNTGASETFRTTTGTHFIYPLVNAPASLVASFALNTTTINSFETTVQNVASVEDLKGATAGFLMTNVTKPAAVNFAAGGTETSPMTIPAIQVGRALAKVNVEFDPTVENGGELTSVEYKVVNNPNKMYLAPNYIGTQLNTPYFSATPVVPGNYFANAAFTVADGTTATYAIENANAASVKQGEATYVQIKGVFTPSTWFDATTGDELTTAPTTGSTFWRIFEPTTGLYTSKIYNGQPQAAEIADATSDPTPRLDEYVNGVCYYKKYLAQETLTDEAAKYTVRRNKYFYVTITSVSGPGVTDPGELVPNPETPVEVSTFIEAEIEVLNWELVDQQGGI